MRGSTPKFTGLEKDTFGKPISRRMLGTVDLYSDVE
jgi:hypothetical protein